MDPYRGHENVKLEVHPDFRVGDCTRCRWRKDRHCTHPRIGPYTLVHMMNENSDCERWAGIHQEEFNPIINARPLTVWLAQIVPMTILGIVLGYTIGESIGKKAGKRAAERDCFSRSCE